MPNMSYCRMENTYNDLRDCYDNWDEVEGDSSEEKYRNKILSLCKKIVDHYSEETEEEEN